MALGTPALWFPALVTRRLCAAVMDATRSPTQNYPDPVSARETGNKVRLLTVPRHTAQAQRADLGSEQVSNLLTGPQFESHGRLNPRWANSFTEKGKRKKRRSGGGGRLPPPPLVLRQVPLSGRLNSFIHKTGDASPTPNPSIADALRGRNLWEEHSGWTHLSGAGSVQCQVTASPACLH